MWKRIESVMFLDRAVYSARWLALPMYLTLIVALGLYSYKCCCQLWELIEHFTEQTEDTFMLAVLGLLDITMLGNLIVMILIGGYSIFIRKIASRSKDERPQWLDAISSSSLKIKIGMSMIGVTSVYLLKDFIGEHPLSVKHVVLHAVFVLSTLLLAATAWVTHKSEHTNGHDVPKIEKREVS